MPRARRGDQYALRQRRFSEHTIRVTDRKNGKFSGGTKIEFLYDESFVVAAGAQNPWARRRRIELAELVSESWVLPPPGSVIGSIVREAFRASGLDYPRTTVVTDSPQVRISLVATGRFVTILPASALRFPAKRSEIKILPVKLPNAHLPNEIVTLKNRALSPVVQLFIDCAREVARPLAK